MCVLSDKILLFHASEIYIPIVSKRPTRTWSHGWEGADAMHRSYPTPCWSLASRPIDQGYIALPHPRNTSIDDVPPRGHEIPSTAHGPMYSVSCFPIPLIFRPTQDHRFIRGEQTWVTPLKVTVMLHVVCSMIHLTECEINSHSLSVISSHIYYTTGTSKSVIKWVLIFFGDPKILMR